MLFICNSCHSRFLGFATAALLALGATRSFSGGGFEEFSGEQDRFHYRWNGPLEATISVKFCADHTRTKPLLLAIPLDVTPEWELLSARGFQGQTETQVESSQVENLDGFLQFSRIELSDIPLLEVTFEKSVAVTIRLPEAHTQAAVRLDEATFCLKFSQPLSAVRKQLARTLGPQKDAFRQICENLVANPQDIDTVRGLSETVARPRDREGYHPVSLGIHSDGSRHSSLRIKTVGTGIARLSGRMMREAGFDLNANPVSRLSLFHCGNPWPLGVISRGDERFNDDDEIWFHFLPIESDQTNENVFFLTWGEETGARYEEAGDFRTASASDLGTVRSWDYRFQHLEEDNGHLYEPVGSHGAVEIFWKKLTKDEHDLTVQFDLPGLIEDETPPEGANRSQIAESVPCWIRCASGAKLNQATPTVTLQINGRKSAGIQVKLDEAILKTSIPTEALRERGNRLRISLVQEIDAGSESELLVDWIRIWYPAASVLEGGLLVKTPSSETPDRVADAKGVVWRQVSPGAGNWRLLVDDGGGRPRVFNLRDGSESGCVLTPSQGWDADWVVFDLDKAAAPRSVERVSGPRLHSSRERADLLVVTEKRFVPELADHLAWREKQGWRSRLVTVQEIYDEFSFGIKDLDAIRAYCRFALENYDPPRLQYLWLVGESRWDPRNLLKSEREDLVPSPPLGTARGTSSNDQDYVFLLGQDFFPDLLVSRVSVSLPEELSAYLAKVRLMEEDPPLGWWRSRDLLLADEAFEELHPRNLDRGLKDYVFPVSIRLVDYPLDTIRSFEAVGKEGKEARGIRPDVVEKWAEGASLVEYIGHGGVTVWSTRAFFKGLNRPDSDVDRLRNENRYPFVLIRSCLSGTVNWPTFPGEVSVAEALIEAPTRGAIAALGSCGAEPQPELEAFARHIHGALWNHRLHELALVRGYAQCQFVLEYPNSPAVANQFMLHGDPLLRLSFPEPIERISSRWERDRPRLHLEWENLVFPGSGQIRIHRHGELLFESPVFDLTKERETGDWPIPVEAAVRDHLVVSLYTWSENVRRDAFGSLSLPSYPVESLAEENLDSETQNPVLRAELAVSKPPLVADRKQEIVLRLLPSPGLSEEILASATVSVEGSSPQVLSLPISPDREIEKAFSLQPQSGDEKRAVRVTLQSQEGEARDFQQEFHGALRVSPEDPLEFPDATVDPTTPVEGETAVIRQVVRNVGSQPVEILTARGELVRGSSGNGILEGVRFDLDPFPVAIVPGEEHPFEFRCEAKTRGEEVRVRLAFKTHYSEYEREVLFRVAAPPEIVPVAVLGSSCELPIPLDEPIDFLIRVKNVGDVTSESLLLRGKGVDSSVGDFETVLPAVAPGRLGEAAFRLETQSCRFQWDTILNLLPKALSSRTKWNPSRIETEIPRSLVIPGIPEGRTWERTFETSEDLAPFHVRYLDRSPIGFLPSEAAVIHKFRPEAFEILDYEHVLSATQATLAAIQNPQGWWLSPDEVQAHPAWKGTPFRFRVSWKNPPGLVRVSAMFGKADETFGYPMPGFTLAKEGLTFDLDPRNTPDDLACSRPRLTEITGASMEWVLTKKPGLWPGFLGLMALPLPEIRTPVLALPDTGDWKPEVEIEWAGGTPDYVVVEGRSRLRQGDWTPWSSLARGGTLSGELLQLRCWFDPTTSVVENLIRSVTIRLKRQD